MKTKHRGIGLVWTVAFLLALIAIGGLVIDASRVYITGHQLQNAADASALAGARYVAWDPNSATKIAARLEALEYSQANKAANLAVNLDLNTPNAPAGDIVIGIYNPNQPNPLLRFTPMSTSDMLNRSPNAMKIVTRKDDAQNPKLPLVFGSMFGVSTSNIQKYAIAMIYNASGAAVIALSDSDIGVYLHGTPEINIANNGSIYSNTVGTSADFRGTPGTEVAEINLVGDYNINGSFNTNEMDYEGLPTVVNTNMPPIEDPYKNLPAPTYSTTPDLGTISASGTYNPGYYSGGIQISTGNFTLNPGIYILDGNKNKGGLDISGGIVNAHGVLFYVIGGSVDIRGNTQLTLSPPTSGNYAGVSIFQSRTNTNEAEINGGGGLNMTGTLYFPNNKLWVAGNGDTIGTQLIADTIEIGGNGLINIPYNGSPQVAASSYLVE